MLSYPYPPPNHQYSLHSRAVTAFLKYSVGAAACGAVLLFRRRQAISHRSPDFAHPDNLAGPLQIDSVLRDAVDGHAALCGHILRGEGPVRFEITQNCLFAFHLTPSRSTCCGCTWPAAAGSASDRDRQPVRQ